MKYTIAIIAAMLLIGCGSDSTTYVAEPTPLPEVVPTNGTNIVVTADDESNVGLSYTEVGDGAILVECGNGDGDCSITVYEAEMVEEVNTTI